MSTYAFNSPFPSTILSSYQEAADTFSSGRGLVLTLPEGETAFPVLKVNEGASRAAWRAANGVIGLVAEAIEALPLIPYTYDGLLNTKEKKLLLELGDICWYVAEVASSFGINLGTLQVLSNPFDIQHYDIVTPAGELGDYIKKLLWHGHPVNWVAINQKLVAILMDVNNIALSVGSDLPTVLQMNVDKLSKRYPARIQCEGFSRAC